MIFGRFCSSRPSIASIDRPSAAAINVSDRSYQLSALRSINSFLASQSAPFSLKHPLPSAKDITETLKLLLQHLVFASQKIDEDLSHVLKIFKCPLKLNKSALRAPGTPHSWPNLLAVIHWLVQVPKQPDRFQCGYYVMKYLREIIESDGLKTITSLQSLFNKNSYSTEEIDQVRTEWADCVQEYMYA